jgi:hypothetical protein
MKRPKWANREGTLPRELERSTPRPVHLTALGIFAAVSAVALGPGAIAAGLVLWSIALFDAERLRLFDNDGRTTEATVTEVRRGEGREVRIRYRYIVDGREYENRARLRGRNAIPRPEVGSQIPIRYIASRPHESWARGARPRQMPLWIPVLVAIATALCAIPIWWAIRQQKHLLANGRAAVAHVTAARKTNNGYGTVWRTEYEWSTLSGSLRKGRFETEKQPAVGTAVTVVYDPDDPGWYLRYPPSLVRAGTR